MSDIRRNRGSSRRDFLARAAVGAMAGTAFSTAAFAQTSDRKIRIGVVGGGFGTQFQWHQHPNCHVEAVSDFQPARRELLTCCFVIATPRFGLA